MTARPFVLATRAFFAAAALGTAASPVWAEVMAVRVADDRGSPIAGARVSLWHDRDGRLEPDAVAVSGEDGRVEFAPGRAGRLRLSATATGFRRAEREVSVPPPTTVTLRLERGRSLLVAVRDAATGKAIPRFTALVVPRDAAIDDPGRLAYVLDGLEPVAVEDEQGLVQLTGLGDGRATLTVRAAGYPLGVVEFAPRAEPVVVLLDATGCTERWVFDAATGAPVAGAVVAPDAALLQPERFRLAALPESDEVGRLALCPAPGVAELLIVHPDYAPALIVAPLAAAGQVSAPPVRLGAGGAVTGRVTNRDGLPVVNADVRTNTLGLLRETRTGADGRFSLTRLAPGTVTIEVAAPLTGEPPLGRRSVAILDGQTSRADFDAAGELRVLVTEEDEPRPGAHVVLLAPGPRGRLAPAATAVTDGAGEARFPAAVRAPGTQLVAIVEERSAVFVSLAEARTDRPTVARLDGRRVRGVVADAASRAPLAGARLLCSTGALAVRYEPERGPLWLPSLERQVVAEAPMSFATTDDAGGFEFFLPTWCSDLRVAGPDSGAEQPWRPTRVAAADLHPNTPALILLEHDRLIVAAIASSSGPVDAPVEVSLHRPGDRASLSSTSAEDGTARLHPWDAGPWLVLARANGWAPAMAGPVTAPERSTLRLQLILERGGLLLVRRSTSGDGPVRSPASGDPPLRITDAAGQDWTPFVESTTPSPEGYVTLGPLPAGRYAVVAGDVRRSAALHGDGDVQEVDLAP